MCFSNKSRIMDQDFQEISVLGLYVDLGTQYYKITHMVKEKGNSYI